MSKLALPSWRYPPAMTPALTPTPSKPSRAMPIPQPSNLSCCPWMLRFLTGMGTSCRSSSRCALCAGKLPAIIWACMCCPRLSLGAEAPLWCQQHKLDFLLMLCCVSVCEECMSSLLMYALQFFPTLHRLRTSSYLPGQMQPPMLPSQRRLLLPTSNK